MNLSHLKPQRQAIALEQRIMFDGAAAAAVDHRHAESSHAADLQRPTAAPAEAAASAVAAAAAAAPVAPAPTVVPAPRELLVVDSRVPESDLLTSGLGPNVTVLRVDADQDGLAAISAELKQLGPVDSIQILSHGAAGQFTLGDRTISSDNVDQLASILSSWSASLSPGADIQLYGCDVGAGPSGQILVDELAHWTGADVAASSDATGSAAADGNWTLETHVGVIDKPIALSDQALAGFTGLLADAGPTVSLSSASTDALLGGQFTFTASFSNASSQTGYAPYIDLFFPSTGKDGDDGVSFVSATYLGQPIKTFVLTVGADGTVTDPLAKGTDGNPVVIDATQFGLRAGDQVVVLQLPNASITQGQPSVDIQVTAQVSNLADTAFSNGSPDLTIQARGGFQFGNDSADDPTIDPSLIEAGSHSFVVHPTVVQLTQTVDVPDGVTVTGPNYPRSFAVTASAAPGQQLSDIVVTQPLPSDIIVTGITPDTGGTLASVTLFNGQVLTAPAAIQAAFARGAYLSSYTVDYATLSGSATTTVDFYVPQSDGNGQPVIDPASGAPVEIDLPAPTASANWVPLDPRDVVAPATNVEITGTGPAAAFTAEAIAVYKQAIDTGDIGTPGVTPGDTLTYSLTIDMSDYFAFGQNILGNGRFVVDDALGNGQTVVPSSGTLSYTVAGVTQSIPLVFTSTPNADGTTTLVLDLAASLRQSGKALGALPGDLAFDSNLDGATVAVVSYQATVAQAYTGGGLAQPAINEGDSVGNDATVSATILEDQVNLAGGVATGSDSTTSTVPVGQVDLEIVSVNGAAPPADGELRPGDTVTFSLSYDLVTGDYEQMSLTGYLPLPLFDASTVAWTQGNGVDQWNLAASNTNPGAIVSVSAGAGNSIVFNFGSYSNPGTSGTRIDVQFTMQVSDLPFGDHRTVTALAQSDQLTTIQQTHLTSQAAVPIVSVAEPVLSLTHGVVASSDGTVTGTTGSWAAAGSAGVPFAGSITDPEAVNGDVSGIDGGDLLRLATEIENTGGGGAFDVRTSIDLPTGLAFSGGSLAAANLKIYRGDGTALVLGVDYAVVGNEIDFLDANGIATLLPGRSGSTADGTGSNVVVITYDTVVANAIAAGSTLQSSATLSNYASVEGGDDFTTADLHEVAGEQVAAPALVVAFADGSPVDADSSSASTSGSDLVIGESMLYDIVVTLPEGTAQTLRIDDLVPAGMHLDTSFNGVGYELITTAAGSAVLTADFNGTLAIGSVAGIGGTVGSDGVGARMTFSASSAAADNVSGNNSFVIRVRLVADNVIGNQADRSLQNSAQLVYADPDGDTAGGAALDRTVAVIGGAPTVTLREPTLSIAQTTSAVPPLGVDEGDAVSYTITISNSTGAADVDAFDIAFNDALPTAQLQGMTLTGVTYAGGATNNGGADFAIVGGVLQTVAGANIDIPKGGSIVLQVTGTVDAQAVNASSIVNTASVQWTSLDGTSAAPAAGERTGADGVLASGVLNDYRSDATSSVRVLGGVELSRIGGLPATPPSPDGTLGADEQAAIGELVRYRAVAAVGQGVTNDFSIQITLQQGLEFLNDGTVRVSLVSDGGLTTDLTDLITAGVLAVTGNQDGPLAQPISVDLSGGGATGTMNPVHIDVSADGSVITFHFGTLTNTDSDNDVEYVALEFSARVQNVAGNQAGTVLSATPETLAGSTVLFTGQPVSETLVEPAFGGLTKQVESFTPNLSGTEGQADLALRFTQDGSATAYDVQLTDGFPSATAYAVSGVEIDGVTYAPGNLPAGVTVSTSLGATGGIMVSFDHLDPGQQVAVFYSATVPDTAAVAGTNASLTWTSLPTSFTSFGGSNVGVASSADGERTGSAAGPNDYVLTADAGLGFVSGQLWDDSASATADATPDGPPIAGQTVTLLWAGPDGDLATAADNQSFTAVTDAAGDYSFGALAAGNYRVLAPVAVTEAQPVGALQVRIDSDGVGADGQVTLAIGQGASAVANAGYVQQNDAPVNTLPGPQSAIEDTPLALAPIQVSDVDADNGSAPGILDVVLGVAHGTLGLAAGAPPAVLATVVSGEGTATLTLSGTLDQLNAALAQLTYQGTSNFNGADTLTVTTRDRGNFGDANGDGIPGQLADQLQDVDTLAINVAAVNDAPVAVPDTADALEAGGAANGTPGVNPTGNLLTNDTDVDIATNADVLHVASIQSAATGVTLATQGSTPVSLAGQYGTLVFRDDGGWQYVVDNANPTVQALLPGSAPLTEVFNYTMADSAGAPGSSTLTVTIRGANDTPVGVDDVGNAVEAGGVLNTTGNNGAGNATGNVLTNDTDVDSTADGETRSVTGIRALPESAAGPLQPMGTIVGTYGTLTIAADGSYTYVANDSDPQVQRLVPGDILSDTFSYQVTDAGGLSDLATLRIDIHGSNDNPVATNDVAQAQAQAFDAAGSPIGQESNPTGNLILDPSRPGTPDQAGGNGIDYDVDRTDQPNSLLQVTSASAGQQADGVALGAVAVGTPIVGAYGTLTLNPDGSYSYDVDSTNAAVRARQAGEPPLDDIFTYEITDTSGLTARAQLNVQVFGVNDPPVAQRVVAVAVEAGGVDNGTPGTDPTGNALRASTDPDGDPLTVVAIRTGATTDAGGTAGIVGASLAGQYGALTLQADGSYAYVLDNANPAVQALRTPADTLIERFTFTESDGHGGTGRAEIDILVTGRDDNPVAVDDTGRAMEAGGVANNVPGQNATGNLLANDSDVDGGAAGPIDYGEVLAVSSVRTGTEAGTGTAGTAGTELRGSYGWLTVSADGAYSYRVDDTLAAVQALRTSGDTLQDSFSYTVADAAGAQDRATLTITVVGADDAPVASNDAATAIEAGGVANGTAGFNPSGNVIANDSDVDAGDTLAVAAFSEGARAGTVGAAFAGNYGSLLLNADGSYSFTLDNANSAVQALRTAADTLSETFTYTLRDTAGLTSSATLTITIVGRNDSPVAVDDQAVAQEAGGTLNGTPGIDPAGNLLANDTDVDGSDTRTLDGIRTGTESAGGAFVAVGTAQVVQGQYGTLTVSPDGSYVYQVDNTLAAVQAMRAGDSLPADVFTYRMHDAAGTSDTAQVSIVVTGAWDAPVGHDDQALAVAASATHPEVDPTGNVLPNDNDVDRADVLQVSGIRANAEAAGGALAAVSSGTDHTDGTLVNGQFGQLIIGADGSYTYRVDSNNPQIIALAPLGFVVDTFAYRVTDLGGLSDLAQLTVIVRGRNDAPVANDDTGVAVEAGGLHNTTPGRDPAGNVLANDTDVDGDALSVTAIRVGDSTAVGAAGAVGTSLRGLFGNLTLNADGSWSYALDNSLPAVEALRTPGQTLTDVFTYTASDIFGTSSTAQLRVVILGSNDTPIAVDDAAVAVEAGGVHNGTPGVDPSGNVLVNDTDVDSAANGETRQVADFSNSAGASATAGSVLAGLYGNLSLNADGSYTYHVDNANPAVEALRTAGDTLTEVFTYRVRDTAGAESQARLVIVVRGADDKPVAADDANVASDQTRGPQATGNVLSNDTDVDAGDALRVVAIRTGPEAGSGTAGSLDQALVGRYGTLVIHADGSYSYTIDQSNHDVLAAAGAGPVLQDVFTYTVSDRAGATDSAQLVISLDIGAPYIPPGPDPWFLLPQTRDTATDLGFEPGIFVQPVVRLDARFSDLTDPVPGGSDVELVLGQGIHSQSLGAGLGTVPGQFVHLATGESRAASELDLARFLTRHGRTSLSADGLLSDPSIYAYDSADLLLGPAQRAGREAGGTGLDRAVGDAAAAPRVASGFTEQLQAASERLRLFRY